MQYFDSWEDRKVYYTSNSFKNKPKLVNRQAGLSINRTAICFMPKIVEIL